MAVMAIKMRIMPASPETDLEALEKNIKKLVEQAGGKNCTFSEEPVAFGLKAVIAFFAWPEEKELEIMEADMRKIKNVNSVQITDMRRAFGS